MKRILAMAHEANQFVANRAPWADAGKDPERARATCTAAVNAFAKLNVMLTPVCPVLCARVEKILGRGPTTFASVRDRLLDRGLNPFENIFTKVAEENVQKMVEAAAEAPAPSVPPAEAIKVEPLEPTIAFDEFAKVDLRVARVVEAKVVEGADKLLQLTIDLGPLGQRNIFAGIRKSHDPASLVGSHIIVVANLAPRKMKFGLSEGMLLACGPGDKTLFLATTQPGAKPGERLH
jgi:methionyl-tRNA synthetase